MTPDQRRLERKIPSLLCTGPSTGVEGNTEYKRAERIVKDFKRKNPYGYQSALTRLFQAVAEFDRVATLQAQAEIDRLNRRTR